MILFKILFLYMRWFLLGFEFIVSIIVYLNYLIEVSKNNINLFKNTIIDYWPNDSLEYYNWLSMD